MRPYRPKLRCSKDTDMPDLLARLQAVTSRIRFTMGLGYAMWRLGEDGKAEIVEAPPRPFTDP